MNYVSKCCKSSRLLKPKFIVICLMSLFTIECQSSTLKNDTNKQQEVYRKLESAVKAELNDPESVNFYNVRKIQDDSVDEDSISYCGEVKEKVTAGGYGEKKRFIYSVENDEAYIIPIEKPDDEVKEFSQSILWKVRCQKNNIEIEAIKLAYWFEANKELEEVEDVLDMLKNSENSPEYLEAKKKYESLKKRADRLKKEITIYN